jgi:outer membrane murein-binding lipoprotein Lpp
MVFANIYSRLNEIEQKLTTLSDSSVTKVADNQIAGEVVQAIDLSPLNNKIEALEGKMTDLSEKFDALPTSFVSQQDITNQYEKINQITTILAQLNVQLSNLVTKVNDLEEKIATGNES